MGGTSTRDEEPLAPHEGKAVAASRSCYHQKEWLAPKDKMHWAFLLWTLWHMLS